MSVMAGALGVELEKIGHYCLGAGQALPAAQDIHAAVRLLAWAVVLAVGLLAIVQVLLSCSSAAHRNCCASLAQGKALVLVCNIVRITE